MSKLILQTAISFSILLLTAITVEAQIIKPGVTLGINLLGALPQGDFKDEYSLGAGGEIFGGVGWGRTFLLATAGYSAFKAASDNGKGGILTYIPLKIGVKQYFLRKLLFINADLGIASVKNKLFNESRFTRGVGAGIKLLGLEAGLYYDGWKNIDPQAKGFQNSIFSKLGYSFTF
jgi:hypothetical protein